MPDVRSILAQLPWVAIQRNRRSGSGRQHRAIVELIAELKHLHILPRLYARRELLDSEIARRGCDSLLGIVAAGGDGTVLDVINRHPGIPVAILPLGTENLVARHLGIPPRDGCFVAHMIAGGHTLRLDLGRVGDRRFTVMASCGFDAEVIHRAHAGRTGHITRRHYHRPIWHSFRTYEFQPIRVFADGSDSPVTGTMVVVANLPQYALGLPLAPDARPDDGLLDVLVLGHESSFQLLRDFGNVLLRRRRVPSEVGTFRAAAVRLEADVPLPVQADGDPAGTTPVEIRVEPRAARLFVPSQERQAEVGSQRSEIGEGLADL